MEMTTVVTSAYKRLVAPTPASFQGRGVSAGEHLVRRRDGLGDLLPTFCSGLDRAGRIGGGIALGATSNELDSLPGAAPV